MEDVRKEGETGLSGCPKKTLWSVLGFNHPFLVLMILIHSCLATLKQMKAKGQASSEKNRVQYGPMVLIYLWSFTNLRFVGKEDLDNAAQAAFERAQTI